MSGRNKLKITVLKRQDPAEIFETLPVAKKDWMVPCGVYEDGQEFVVENMRMPEGFCGSAWQTIYPNVRTLGYGGNLPYFDEEGVSVTCCADGMRPVIFKIERI
ncbi:MAG: TIGR04076 family protein [Candidatus Bathyarchaeota archaeon]|nr:MAG: TIGR04076 family protein [Candidatus Bathyarchaeota archaeon]